ncbi:hypothetical protein I6H08_36485 (plasmid) [Burkholderia gladioli]|nr:hypothetical protein I6H08_36485 [Burkholderia gladioli]
MRPRCRYARARRIHGSRHMNDRKQKDDAVGQQRRKYEQDNATDDGMPTAPEVPTHTCPTEQERLRTAKQRIADSRKRWGMVYPSN